MWNYDYKNLQEEEIEFILFSLCAFEKSLDLGCNFIIIFLYKQEIKLNVSCKTSESGRTFFETKKKKIKSKRAKRLWEVSCLV